MTNLEVETPDKYFVETGTNVKEYIEQQPISCSIQEENSWEYHCGSI